MLCNVWTLVVQHTASKTSSVHSLFTRWRHTQYNQHKLKAQTSRRSSIYIFLLHCVDNWTVLAQKTYFRPYVVIIVEVLCRINTTFYLAVQSIDHMKTAGDSWFFHTPPAFDAPIRGVLVGISPPRWKTRMVWLPDGEKIRRYVYSFWHDPRTWQTDRRTLHDGIDLVALQPSITDLPS